MISISQETFQRTVPQEVNDCYMKEGPLWLSTFQKHQDTWVSTAGRLRALTVPHASPRVAGGGDGLYRTLAGEASCEINALLGQSLGRTSSRVPSRMNRCEQWTKNWARSQEIGVQTSPTYKSCDGTCLSLFPQAHLRGLCWGCALHLTPAWPWNKCWNSTRTWLSHRLAFEVLPPTQVFVNRSTGFPFWNRSVTRP